MKFFSTVAIASLASAVLAVPVDDLQKRTTCTLTATWEVNIVIGSGGIGQAPVSSTATGFNLAKPGAATKYINANSIKEGTQTIKGSDLGLSQDISYTSNFRTSSFHSCSAKYGNGAEVDGKPGGGDCKASDGSSCADCVISFSC